MEWIASTYGIRYAENSRETIRRQTLHQLVQAGIVEKNPDDPERPVNSPKTSYRLSEDVASVLRSYSTSRWDAELASFLSRVETLQSVYAQARERRVLSVAVAPGVLVALSPGGQNPLIKRIVEEFTPQFVREPRVLYIGDAQAKQGYRDEASLVSLNVILERHGQMPDVIIYDAERNWLILVEAVTSHGPMNPKRVRELKQLLAGSTVGLVFVTAFPDRRTFGKYQSDIAWETEVWIAEDPTHLIHYNGERFLGPYR
jgi:hypothetical protein